MPVTDIEMVKSEYCYNGNPKLKKAGVTLPFTQEQVTEYIRCQQDIIYFVKNYVKIVTLDHGLIPFNLYPFQENMLHSFQDNRFSINLLSRQLGKCVCPDTAIKIRNRKTGECKEIAIGDFFNERKIDETINNVL